MKFRSYVFEQGRSQSLCHRIPLICFRARAVTKFVPQKQINSQFVKIVKSCSGRTRTKRANLLTAGNRKVSNTFFLYEIQKKINMKKEDAFNERFLHFLHI